MHKEELLESFSVNELEIKTEFSILGCGPEDPDCGGERAEFCED